MIGSKDIQSPLIPEGAIIQVVTPLINAIGIITSITETTIELTPIPTSENGDEGKQVIDTLPVIKIIPLSEIKLIFILDTKKDINE